MDSYSSLLDRLAHEGQLAYEKTEGAQKAVFEDMPGGLSPELLEDLRWNFGIKKLFCHQRQAYDLLSSGKNVIITTPTASGKSLCYNLPCADALIKDADASALYIYPTKALAADQLKSLEGFGCLKGRVFTYDGDTPFEDREYIRKRAGIILTNPDMLHLSVLPRHAAWARFFANLRYIVVDEAHTYYGLFASHMAFILRRLLAVCSYRGSSPQFVFTSATIANPEELAETMTGLPFVLAGRSGAPSGKRTIGFWNPPLLGSGEEVRRSAPEEASRIASSLVKNGLRTIVFGRSRLAVELMTKKVKKELEAVLPDAGGKIVSYRAGYTPERRRKLERQIFSGKVVGIFATSALELGIDIGSLDVCISAGCPGRMSALWQQFGRVGRGEKDSLCVLVAQNSPIDQYYMQHPGEFFEKRTEKCIVDTGNPYVVADQLSCSLKEMPMTADEIFAVYGETGLDMLSLLLDEGLAGYAGSSFMWLGKTEPAGEVNIRGSLGEPYEIVSLEDGGARLLGTCDEGRVYYTVYPGAVYIHEGESYIVRCLDPEDKTAYVEPTSAGYYTVANEQYRISEKKTVSDSETKGGFVRFGFSLVTVDVPSFTKKAVQGGRILGKTDISVPSTELYTQSVCFDVSRDIMNRLAGRGMDPAGSLHALEHILIAAAPVMISCDRNAVGGVSFLSHPSAEGRACVFVYDGIPGGCGICGKLFSDHEGWFEKALQLISACPCRDGCPGCVQSPKCGNNNSPLDKAGALFLLEALLKGT
ncbi:MAG: DEAD/DEAH box helicase [Abditibacteriota bacterium]|nr:DEAD/DEAH box helicase [Abditibacteriota bacterium]